MVYFLVSNHITINIFFLSSAQSSAPTAQVMADKSKIDERPVTEKSSGDTTQPTPQTPQEPTPQEPTLQEPTLQEPTPQEPTPQDTPAPATEQTSEVTQATE